jgi:hypothetical protein
MMHTISSNNAYKTSDCTALTDESLSTDTLRANLAVISARQTEIEKELAVIQTVKEMIYTMLCKRECSERDSYFEHT